uniref:Uncharacterized protein n=2 Tax=Ixodes scapularis TaxID=6945 RepID=A0A1S4LZ54_IXOSC
TVQNSITIRSDDSTKRTRLSIRKGKPKTEEQNTKKGKQTRQTGVHNHAPVASRKGCHAATTQPCQRRRHTPQKRTVSRNGLCGGEAAVETVAQWSRQRVFIKHHTLAPR